MKLKTWSKPAAMAKAAMTFGLPGGLILLLAVILSLTGLYAVYVEPFLGYVYWVVLAVGIVLGVRFNRSRLVLSLMVVYLAGWSLERFAAGANGGIVWDSITLLLPLNLMMFSLMKERGIFTARGISRLVAIMLQAALVWWLCRQGADGPARYLDWRLIDVECMAGLSQPALLAFLLAAVVTIVRYWLDRCIIIGGIFWAIVTCLCAFAPLYPDPAYCLAVAALIMIVSVIEATYSIAYMDELTGLPARRALNEELLKLGGTYSIAMLDIDFFKKFNDRYGHDVGDQVLRMVAARLAQVGGGGRAFRYGGEEFSIVFHGRGVDESLPYLEELRRTIMDSSFTIRKRPRPKNKPANPRKARWARKKVHVTVSMGCAQRNDKNARPQDVIKAADKAVYRAKNAGRNRVCT